MRKIKKLAIAIILIMILVIVYKAIDKTNTVESYSSGGKGKLKLYSTSATWMSGWDEMTENGNGWGPYYSGAKDGTYYWRGSYGGDAYFGVNLDTIKIFTNVYCAQKNKLIACPVMWCDISWSVDLVGKKARFYYHNSDGTRKSTPFKETEESENNQMAYLVNLKSDRTAQMDGWNSQYGSNTQHQFWWFWNSWAEANGISDTYSGNNSGYKENVWSEYNSSKTYTASLYYLDVEFGEKNTSNNLMGMGFGPQGTDWDDGQNMVVTGDKPPAVENIDISVKKVWDDSNDAYGNRPDSVTANLYLNDTYKASLTLDSDNSWAGTFKNLTKTSTYTVSEPTVSSAYNTSVSGDATNGFTITNTLKKTNLTVKKTWDDDSNRDGIRPTSVSVTLYENGQPTSTTATLNASNSWTYKFSSLPLYKEGSKVTYTARESVPTGYTPTNTDDSSKRTTTIKNTHVPERINIQVTKKWEDVNDLDDLRPASIVVKLYANGKDTGQTATLSASNNWTATFTNLYKYESGKEISYTVKEKTAIDKYTTVQGDANNNYTITNTHVPYYDGYVEITGLAWMDGAPGKGSKPNGVYSSEDKPLPGIIARLKDANGNLIKSTYSDENKQLTRTDYAITAQDGTYTIRVNYDNSENVYKLYETKATIDEKLKNAYVEFEYDGMIYTTVANATTGTNTSKVVENITERTQFDRNHATTNSSTEHPDEWEDKAITAKTGKIVSYTSTKAPREEVIKYCNGNGTYDRTKYDDPTVVQKNKTHTCSGCKGAHDLAKYEVEVESIPNINIGLFQREQPDVAIFSDLTKVEVTMNGQKYTYLYGVRGTDKNDVGLKVKFENKDTYTYRRPVNPADIAYITEPANSGKMEVYVTYEIQVANLSTTLTTTINEIVNVYDPRYEIQSIVKGKENPKAVTKINNPGIYNQPATKDFNEVKLTNLNIELGALKQATDDDTIVIRYKINQAAIEGLLTNKATLNNGVEILSYKTTYGAATVYAEQGTNGRTENPYGGYDYDSHPGNAHIELRNDADGTPRLRSTATGTLDTDNIIDPPEDDTDFAPSFVLESTLTAIKTLAGTVWEDSNTRGATSERVGDGYYNQATEANVENVKVELYNLDGSRAKLYDDSGNARDAVTYTTDTGAYELTGVVTGEYFIKYTYGNNTTGEHTTYQKTEAGINQEVTEIELQHATKIDSNTTVINARDYKSTIISNTDSLIKTIFSKDYASFTDEEKEWHMRHKDNYNIAVDNMLDRLSIRELTYYSYDIGENMTAYTKPFKTLVEFEITGKSQSDKDGNMTGVSNKIETLDFGIIERPREDLFVQKTITNFKVVLANGQILTEGNPSDPNANIPYAKTMGFKESLTAEQARQSLDKQLLIEMDAELIQGAQLEVQYAVKVSNKNEIDYDYGTDADYSDILLTATIGEGDKYITKSTKANYYYYGESAGLSEMKATIEFVDYLDKDLIYKEDLAKWVPADEDDLYTSRLISDNVKQGIKDNGYRPLQSASGASIVLGRNEFFSQDMTASKLLANQDENVFDNNAEILKIDGKTGRTVKAKDDTGHQIMYRPGNYVPSLTPGTFEHDDDRVKIMITPPTGLINNTPTYILVALAVLVTAFIVIVIVKKKVINK